MQEDMIEYTHHEVPSEATYCLIFLKMNFLINNYATYSAVRQHGKRKQIELQLNIYFG